MKKICLLLASNFILAYGTTFGQQFYDDMSTRDLVFEPKNGVLDPACANPASNNINNSQTCAKYTRSGSAKYDNIKIYPAQKLTDVSSYSTYLGNPPKIKMKVYTSAPVGTKVEIQLGKKGDDNYPSGIHSQYQAVTTVQNAWEELVFTFSQIPKGSQVSSTEIDRVAILFAPNSSSSDIFYFDDLTIPLLFSTPADTKSTTATPTVNENEKK